MATKRIAAWPHQVGSDALFREACTQVRQALEEAGLERTADTGQINLETVTQPSFDQDAGFDIFKFTDAAQSEHPIFVKVFYGQETLEAMWLRLQAGEGSDGEGNLTGTVSDAGGTAFVIGTSTSPNATAELVVTFKDGALVLAWANGDFQTTSPATIAFGGVERLRTSAGAVEEGFVVYSWRGSSTLFTSQVIHEGKAWEKLGNASGLICLIGNHETGIVGEDTFLGVYIPVGLRAHPPMLGLLGTNENDFVGGTEGKVSRYGSDREYVKIGSDGAEDTDWANTGTPNVGIMVLAE